MQEYTGFFCILEYLVFVFAFGVHRKPAFADTLALLEHFADTPERGESKDTQENGDIAVSHK